MKRFVEGEDRSQSTLFPERLDDYIAEDNPVRVVDLDDARPSQPGGQRLRPEYEMQHATGRGNRRL